jgi:RimJ/RimL family protein N-acetyltransferase
MINRDIRPATLADGALLRAWVNADDSLKWKKDTKNLISTDDHLTWLHSRLADSYTQIWIALHDGTPSGQVRLEKKRDFVYVDIYVVEEARGTGLASFALNESINRYTKLFGTQKFCAIVNHNNKISEKLFVKNEFREVTGKSACWLQFVRVAVAY